MPGGGGGGVKKGSLLFISNQLICIQIKLFNIFLIKYKKVLAGMDFLLGQCLKKYFKEIFPVTSRL